MASLLDNGAPGGGGLDATQLSPADRRELQQFVQNESQKAQIQESIHNLTQMCFKKCVDGRISDGALSRGEEPCLRNCVQRFMDANAATIRHLERMRAAQ